MTPKDEEFLQQLRATFKLEAAEHLQTIGAGLLNLEKPLASDAQGRAVETVFRAAHSLKGAARTVDFIEIESMCQLMEDVFASWKRRESAPSSAVLDTLHRVLDAISAALAAPAGSLGAGASGASHDLKSLRSLLRQAGTSPPPLMGGHAFSVEAVAGNSRAPEAADESETVALLAPVATEEVAARETVRIAVAKLESMLLESEEMLVAKLNAGQRVADLQELTGHFGTWRKAWLAIEPDASRLRQSSSGAPADGPSRSAQGLKQLLDFFDWSLDYIEKVESRTEALSRTAEQDHHAVGKRVDDLLEDAKQLLLLPFAAVSTGLPKLVRDLCRDQGKQADLSIQGEDVEIDKRILEEMKDPLVHLLRNCIDHGIEVPAERVRRGKPARAAITLSVSQISGNKVELLLSDDGAGIDVLKVKASAISQGLISAEEADGLSESEALALVFRSEVSTSPMITQLSGRGLGLAIVREKTEKLNGEVLVESRPGMGAAFRLVVPATRATFRGILIEVAEQQFVVPTLQVERVFRARVDDIKTVGGRETISFGGRALALVRLADVLALPPTERQDPAPGGRPVVVLGHGEQCVAFAVDAVLDEQEVLVKPLRKPLLRVRNIAAATVLGSGLIAPILNVADLLKSARKVSGTPTLADPESVAVTEKIGRILIVEDSITSRMLLKTILESAGYNVKTAVDGMDAFTLLRAEAFDLVVSDVEMPRLNGFDLTLKIRADRRLAELPVVLVTALEMREDRERGIDVGADAYIVKGSFDQNNLLETVRRLI